MKKFLILYANLSNDDHRRYISFEVTDNTIDGYKRLGTYNNDVYKCLKEIGNEFNIVINSWFNTSDYIKYLIHDKETVISGYKSINVIIMDKETYFLLNDRRNYKYIEKFPDDLDNLVAHISDILKCEIELVRDPDVFLTNLINTFPYYNPEKDFLENVDDRQQKKEVNEESSIF